MLFTVGNRCRDPSSLAMPQLERRIKASLVQSREGGMGLLDSCSTIGEKALIVSEGNVAATAEAMVCMPEFVMASTLSWFLNS